MYAGVVEASRLGWSCASGVAIATLPKDRASFSQRALPCTARNSTLRESLDTRLSLALIYCRILLDDTHVATLRPHAWPSTRIYLAQCHGHDSTSPLGAHISTLDQRADQDRQ